MGNDVLSLVLDVFTEVGSWFATFVPSLFALFYEAPTTTGGDGQLTFLGVLAVASLAIAVVMLVVRIISDFLHFSA